MNLVIESQAKTQGRNFKVTCDALVAAKEAKKLKTKLKFKKISRKQSDLQEKKTMTWIRLQAPSNIMYRINRVKKEIEIFPGDLKTVRIITKQEMLASSGY